MDSEARWDQHPKSQASLVEPRGTLVSTGSLGLSKWRNWGSLVLWSPAFPWRYFLGRLVGDTPNSHRKPTPPSSRHVGSLESIYSGTIDHLLITMPVGNCARCLGPLHVTSKHLNQNFHWRHKHSGSSLGSGCCAENHMTVIISLRSSSISKKLPNCRLIPRCRFWCTRSHFERLRQTFWAGRHLLLFGVAYWCIAHPPTRPS